MNSLQIPTEPRRKHLSAFTLVELIVVITVLAILGTVGFLSIGGYSSNARDSQRTADVANVSKSLDAYIVTSGSYPSPDNSFSVTYSGGVVWYQGTFGTGAHSKLGGVGIGKRPLDPLKNSEYAYSVLAFGKAYQLKADYEGSITASNPLIPTAYAEPGNPKLAYIRGNFGGLSARTEIGGMIYVIALPSILTSTGSAGVALDIKSNALSGTLLFNGKSLVNASSFNPNVVVFSGAKLPTSDSGALITNMMSALKTAYAGSDVAAVTPAVTSLVNTATGSLGTFGSSVIVAQLGGTVTTPPAIQDTSVSGTCSSLPVNTVYYNGTTSYSLTNATGGTSLMAATAGYNANPTANTCQFKCSTGFAWNGSVCAVQLTAGSTWNNGYVIATNTVQWYMAESRTFTAPVGFSSADIYVIGGGGASRSDNCWSQAGGGGGFSYRNIPITQGQNIDIQVGNGGASNGQSGGTSSFSHSGVSFGATGGAGGVYIQSYSNGGAGYGGTTNRNGGRGGYWGGDNAQGGGGGAAGYYSNGYDGQIGAPSAHHPKGAGGGGSNWNSGGGTGGGAGCNVSPNGTATNGAGVGGTAGCDTHVDAGVGGNAQSIFAAAVSNYSKSSRGGGLFGGGGGAGWCVWASGAPGTVVVKFNP